LTNQCETLLHFYLLLELAYGYDENSTEPQISIKLYLAFCMFFSFFTGFGKEHALFLLKFQISSFTKCFTLGLIHAYALKKAKKLLTSPFSFL